MAENFQLIHLTIDEARLKGTSSRTRDQFVGCMHAHNELAILNRLLLFAMNDTGSGELHNSAQSVQLWFMIQLLAAKLFEAWIMLNERFLCSNPPDLIPRLDSGQQESRRWLTDYFGSGRGLKASALRIIRDKTAFHYDRLNLTESTGNLATSERSMYLAEHPTNSLYYTGSALVFRTAFAMIADQAAGATVGSHEDRVTKGAEIAIRDVRETNSHMLNLLYGLIKLLLWDIMGETFVNEQQIRINIEGAPVPERVGLPAFIDI